VKMVYIRAICASYMYSIIISVSSVLGVLSVYRGLVNGQAQAHKFVLARFLQVRRQRIGRFPGYVEEVLGRYHTFLVHQRLDGVPLPVLHQQVGVKDVPRLELQGVEGVFQVSASTCWCL
jgi:hypothetical protein